MYWSEIESRDTSRDTDPMVFGVPGYLQSKWGKSGFSHKCLTSDERKIAAGTC